MVREVIVFLSIRAPKRLGQVATFWYECEPFIFFFAWLLIFSIGLQGFILTNFLKVAIVTHGGIILFIIIAFWRIWLSVRSINYVGGLIGWMLIVFSFFVIITDQDFKLMP